MHQGNEPIFSSFFANIVFKGQRLYASNKADYGQADDSSADICALMRGQLYGKPRVSCLDQYRSGVFGQKVQNLAGPFVSEGHQEFALGFRLVPLW